MLIAKNYGGGNCPPAYKSLLHKRFFGTPRSTCVCVAVICLCVLSICISCKTISNIVESGGTFLDTSSKSIASIEKMKLENSGGEIRRLIQKNKAYLEIKLDVLPYITLYGNEPDSAGHFEFTELKYLGGNPSGWNEFYMNISGTATLKNGTLIIATAPVFGTITKAAIRRNSSRLYSTRAVDEMKKRELRVSAITQWMKTQKGVNQEFTNIEDFQNYWMPILLPENTKAKNRPALFTQIQSSTAKDQYALAEEIKWNTLYTKTIFLDDEELISLRDSGSLLRDWEEASPWFYFYYRWDKLF
ncbi:MAG: hypothetical protein Ta2B_01750 [Termitinemataceae bacterium]|nr:MAG: hypothetical protein Ta2B_01750 [Termitinemataceae bacterium]